ncbi:MAG: helix-turn-helix domain-containing protein [Bryobacteraceae bacterium]
MGVSVSRLSHLFKGETGTSLAAYVRGKRLKWAAETLLLSTLSVKEIALAAGFRSTSHFVHQFRREFGVTPRLFRQDDRAACTVGNNRSASGVSVARNRHFALKSTID